MMTAIAVAAALLATSVPPPADPLTTEVGALDAKVFDAYNRCDLPTFSRYFDPEVAFYHDTAVRRSSVTRWSTAFANTFAER